MGIKWLLRRAKGSPMPVEFKAPKIELKVTGAVHKISEIIGNREVGLMLHGKSIEELENRIEEFKDYDVCWVSLNKFDIMQKYILNKIDKNLRMVLDIGEVHYRDDFEKQIRIPRWLEYLQREDDNLLVTSQDIIDGIHEVAGENILDPYQHKIVSMHGCRQLEVPNSLGVYLLLLTQYSAKKIFLFGCDGFGRKSAFKNTPLWSGKEMEFRDENQSLATYFKPEYTKQERIVGFKDETASGLHSDSPTFNDQYNKILSRYCQENNLRPVETVNVSFNSLFTIFRKISYDTLKGELYSCHQ